MNRLKGMHRPNNLTGPEGSYSVEGALTITIFTICILALLSVFSMIRVEGEIQDAINRTAMQISQYSYAVEKAENSTAGQLAQDAVEKAAGEQPEELTKSLLFLLETTGEEQRQSGILLAKGMTSGNFSRVHYGDWLQDQGIKSGYAGLDFSETRILEDGKTVSVVVIYPLEIKTYGLFKKTIFVRERAETIALLPEDRLVSGDRGKDGEGDTIWQQSNFVRGRYFLKKIRENNAGKEVKPGNGIDLYDAASGHYAEGYSLNIFSSMYASCTGSAADPNSYSLHSAAVSDVLEEYAEDLNADISRLPSPVEMADGTTARKKAAHTKTVVIVLPLETKSNTGMMTNLTQTVSAVERKTGVSVQLLFDEHALEEAAE